MNAPLVSILMAVWRPRPNWLVAAVRSALGQAGCEVEVVVVDDGSEPPAAAALAGVVDERLRVVRIEHGGVYRARNAALAEAHGSWIRYFDADDLLPPESTRRLLDLTGGDERVIAYGATLFCDTDLRPVWTMRSRLQGSATRACLLGRFTVRPPAMLFSRSLLDRVGPWDPAFRVAGDWDYVLRATEHGAVRGEGRVALYYRKNAGSVTSDAAAGENGGRRVVARYIERHPEERGGELERLARARLAAAAARAYATRGDRAAALRRARAAAALAPRALALEAVQSLPALAGRARARLRPAPPVDVVPRR